MENEDPTKVDAFFDPRQRRMRGITNHKNLPFDAPIISNITGNLWQGGCENGLLLPDELVHLVSLYPWEAYVLHDHVRSELTVTMYDSVDQEFDQVLELAEHVSRCMDDGPTLVHCQAGLNRSALVAVSALKLRGWTAREAIDLARAKRSPAVLCNPAFEAWLLRDEDPA